MKLAPKYVTDDSDKRTEVTLSIVTYEALLEDLGNYRTIYEFYETRVVI